MHAIEVESAGKTYDGVTALSDVSFTVDSGDLFALVGPNGAGKTTLLRLLTGILAPDTGAVRILGCAAPRDALDRVGYMPEERGLYRDLTPLDTLTYFARLKGLSSREAGRAADEALTTVGMLAHGRRKINELSKGMTQRVQLAATIVHRPELLILDEPFSGLDPVSARDLQEVIRHQRAAGRTVLLSTHNMEHAERLCDRLLMLHRGHVQLYGSLSEIRARYTEMAYKIGYRGTLPALQTASACTEEPGRSLLRPMDGAAARDVLYELLAQGVDITRFEPVTPTLEEIFVRVVGHDAAAAMEESRESRV